MSKKYVIRDNHIIINPNTDIERDLTEEHLECKFCEKNPSTCGHKKIYDEYGFCDWFKILDDYMEIEE